MPDKQYEEALEKNRKTFERWFQDEDTVVGVFECADLSSSSIGHRFALSFTKDQESKMEIGKSRAPDGSWGLGWRYILVAIAHSPKEAMEALSEKEKEYQRRGQ